MNFKIKKSLTLNIRKINIYDLDDIALTVKNNVLKFNSIKIASIHDKNVETAFSLIF